MTQPLIWEITDVYKYSDGYTDPSKVIVRPIDTDNDSVPDNPLQFTEFVNPSDIILYEKYKDFDGYYYDTPYTGSVLDLRNESNLTINYDNLTILKGSNNQLIDISGVTWFIVKNQQIANQFINNVGKMINYIVTTYDTEMTYILTSANNSSLDVNLVNTDNYFIKHCFLQ